MNRFRRRHKLHSFLPEPKISKKRIVDGGRKVKKAATSSKYKSKKRIIKQM